MVLGSNYRRFWYCVPVKIGFCCEGSVMCVKMREEREKERRGGREKV